MNDLASTNWHHTVLLDAASYPKDDIFPEKVKADNKGTGTETDFSEEQ
jgi:hypothetical protein